jgi:IS30 family transposase
VVCRQLRGGWSPASIAGRLPIDYPGDQACRVSHEAIYQWVYAQPVSMLARELISLRTGRKARRGGRRPPPAPRIGEPRYIDERPAEAEGRVVPGHWETDLVIGRNGRSAVATLVERSSRFLILAPLTGRDSLTVGQAVIAATGGLPASIRRSLTWDCGTEMARHASITATGLPVYFAHPHSPWERGSNENLNRIFREFFPKSEIITSDPSYLAMVACEINDRPRKILNWKKPSEYSLNSLSHMLPLVESAAYFQSIRPRTASAACRSVRFSANCRTVTSANCPGEIPGLPRAPNAETNSSSANNPGNSSRTRIANVPFGNAARATAAVRSGISGHGRGWTDIKTSFPRPETTRQSHRASSINTDQHRGT